MNFLTRSLGESSYATTTRAFRRHRIRLNGCTALAGALVALAVIAPKSAQAAPGACGAPVDGAVNCAADGQYPDGIQYNIDPPLPADLTVNIEAGALIGTETAPGIQIANLNGSAILNAAGTTVTTFGDEHAGIVGVVNNGDLTINAGNVYTHGRFYSDGIVTSNGTGQTNITAGTVTTEAYRSYGVASLSKGGDLTIDVGTVLTEGAESMGVRATMDGTYGNGNIALHLGDVTTLGVDATGVNAFNYSQSGTVSVSAGAITTVGDDSGAVQTGSYGATSIDVATVKTSGAHSAGVSAVTIYGDLAVTAGTVATTGEASYGMFAHSFYGNVSVTADTVTTRKDYSAGIYAHSNLGAASLTANTVETRGSNAQGVFVAGGKGATLSIDHISTFGDGSTGAVILGGTPYIDDAGNFHLSQGDTTISVGDVSTSGNNSGGIHSVTYGNNTLHVGSVKTSGENSYGIAAIAVVGSNSITVGSISTEGNASGGIFASSAAPYGPNSDLTLKVGNIETKGEFSKGIRVLADRDDANITLSGTIKTAGYESQGIFAETKYSTANIDNQGKIITTGLYSGGIRVTSFNAHTNINGGIVETHGDRSIGVEVYGVAFHEEEKSINVSVKSVTTTGALATGINLVNPDSGFTNFSEAAGSSIAGGKSDIALVSGLVQTSGDQANAIQINGVGNVTVDSTDTLSAKAMAMVVNARELADVTIRGVTRGGGADAAQITGADVHVALTSGGSITGALNGLVVGAVGPYVPPAPGAGGGGSFREAAVTASSSGTIVIDNAGTIAGGTGSAVLVTAGTASLTNSGKIQGAVTFADGDDRLTNSGTFVATKDSDFGAGNDLFVNTGKLVLQPGGKAGNVTLLGLETFQNHGLVELRNGVGGDTLTLSGQYVASGKAAIGLDLGGNGIADKLIVNGSVTGTSSILLNVTDSNAVLLATPVTLVQVGGGVAANAFSIANQSVGLVTYGLIFNAANNSFQLSAQAGAPVYRLTEVNQGAQAIGRQSGDAWRSHMAELRDVDEPTRQVWGQAYGQVDRRHENRTVAVAGSTAQSYDVGYRQDYYGAQVGVDLGGQRAENGNGLLFGATGGYLSSHMNFRVGADRVHFDAFNVGGYAAGRAGPLFANLLGQYVHYRTAINGVAQWSDRFDGNGYGVQGEVGARLGTDTLFAEPVASLAWQKTDLGTLHALGQSLTFDSDSGLTGSVGARLGGSVTMAGRGKAMFYAKASYVHALSGKGGLLFTSGGTSEAIAGTRLGDYGQAAVGVNVIPAGRVSGFIEGDADFGGSTHGGGGRVGIRFQL
jgi:fibronectin-binding autotransporter adhesin